jgi:hypothetical protein
MDDPPCGGDAPTDCGTDHLVRRGAAAGRSRGQGRRHPRPRHQHLGRQRGGPLRLQQVPGGSMQVGLVQESESSGPGLPFCLALQGGRPPPQYRRSRPRRRSRLLSG